MIKAWPRCPIGGLTLLTADFRLAARQDPGTLEPVIELTGTPGLTYVVQASADLVTWTPFSTNTLTGTALMITNPPPAGPAALQFYQAVAP